MTAHDMLKPPSRYRLRVADYLILHEAGAFEGLRTELIEGEIIVMSPQARRHLYGKSELAYRLRRALETIDSTVFVAVDGTVEISEDSLPEPDIFLTDAPDGEGYVPGASLKLAVEVAATSLDFDLTRKSGLYSSHGVPEYWVADVNGRVIHQMWAPAGEAYAERREVAFGEVVEAVTVAGLRVETVRL
jgi:Uma2 family endonuclease